MFRQSLALVVFIFSAALASAQDNPKVGREAAAKYFQQRGPAESSSSVAPGDHYMALHVGRFMSSQSWEWAQSGREDNVGRGSYGVSYRLDEWNGSMDFGIRIDFNEYDIGGKKPLKMSMMPTIMFPDASSRFPLYFGGGAGLGVFFTQVEDESSLAFDYQLFMGARFFNIFENTGFFVEMGMKNHLLLTSTGQYNGVFLTGGAVFTF